MKNLPVSPNSLARLYFPKVDAAVALDLAFADKKGDL